MCMKLSIGSMIGCFIKSQHQLDTTGHLDLCQLGQCLAADEMAFNITECRNDSHYVSNSLKAACNMTECASLPMPISPHLRHVEFQHIPSRHLRWRPLDDTEYVCVFHINNIEYVDS